MFGSDETVVSCPNGVMIGLHEPMNTLDLFSLMYKPSNASNAQIPQFKITSRGDYLTLHDDSNQLMLDRWWPAVQGKKIEFNVEMKSNPGVAELKIQTDAALDTCNLYFDTFFSKAVQLDSMSPGFVVPDQSKGSSSSSDDKSQPVMFNEPRIVKLELTAKNTDSPVSFGTELYVRVSSLERSDKITLIGPDRHQLKPGEPLLIELPENRSGFYFYVMDRDWGKSGSLEIQLQEKHEHDMSEGALHLLGVFSVEYRSGLPALMIIFAAFLGALLYVAYESFPPFNKKADSETTSNQPETGGDPPGFGRSYLRLAFNDYGAKVVVAFLVATIIWLVDDMAIPDSLKAHLSTFKDFMLLGFCVNVIGLEVIFKKIRNVFEK
jgi:hypothetical protein